MFATALLAAAAGCQVTETGYRLLTAAFPRKLEDVEAWVAAARKP